MNTAMLFIVAVSSLFILILLLENRNLTRMVESMHRDNLKFLELTAFWKDKYEQATKEQTNIDPDES